MLYETVGILRYSMPYKLIVEVDAQLAPYYRSLLPKNLKVNPPRYAPHISVLREEVPVNIDVWGTHTEVAFSYGSTVYGDDLYYWLEVEAPALERIRVELGLPPVSRLTKSPDGIHRFHITIGNTKNRS